MKNRKTIFGVAAAVVLALLIAVEPVRTLALNAMSVFRVEGQATIQITPDDLRYFMENGQTWLAELTEGLDETERPDLAQWHSNLTGLLKHESDAVEGPWDGVAEKLDTVSQFSAYPVLLPRAWDHPELYAAKAREMKRTLALDPINDVLIGLGLSAVPDEWDGAEMTVSQPPMLLATQDGAVLLVCRPAETTLSDNLDPDDLRDIIAELPVFSPSISRQIREMQSNLLYLPNLVGFTQTAEVGGQMALIYPLGELGAFVGGLTGTSETPEDTPLSDSFSALSGTVVVFVRDQTLYVLAGDASVAEMVGLARTMA